MGIARVCIGIDAGGSGTVALVAADESDERRSVEWSRVNLQQLGLGAAVERLVRLVETSIEPHEPVGLLSVCAGVAGAGRPAEQEALANRLRTRLAGGAEEIRLEVVHDALIALEAAFGADSGVIVIAGTGSIVFGRSTAGETIRAGGWGPLLGDPGSGRALGQAGLRAVADAYEGGEETLLTELVRERWDGADREALRREVYTDGFSISDGAPLLLKAAERGDAVASDILETQTAALARQVRWLADEAGEIAPRIQLAGGLTRNDEYVRLLRQALNQLLPDWSVAALEREPAEGALRRAVRRGEEPAT